MAIAVIDSIKIINEDGKNVITLTGGDLSFAGELTMEQLTELNESIGNILDPNRLAREQIKNLRKFNRQAYTHYLKETDPELKKQRYGLYLQTKRLAEELEQGMK